MTDKKNTDAGSETEAGSGDFFNTAAGWVLFAGIIALGMSILAGKFFHGDSPQRPDTPGYVIQGVVVEGAEAQKTMAEALNEMEMDELVVKGEGVFAKCVACHTINQGGANGVGPNLYGVMGAAKGSKPGFGYSSALMATGGDWGWEEMDAWLAAPRRYIDGTTMSFAGLGSVEDRAAVAAYMNANGSNLPVPEFISEASDEEAAAEDEALEEGAAEAEAEETEAAELEEAGA